MIDNSVAKQRIENLTMIIAVSLTWLVVGSILLVKYNAVPHIVIVAASFIVAAIALPTILLVCFRRGVAHLPTTISVKDRLFTVFAIVISIGFGVMAPTVFQVLLQP